MLVNPPADPMLNQHHISIAFPKDLLKDDSGAYVGFLMPAVRNSNELPSIYNPRLRKRKAPGFNWYYLHATALNIAWIIQAIHEKGYVLGDIKPQNILVDDRALVAVIDTDSFQVRDSDTGKVYRCTVGSEGFTPVELLGKDFSTTDQTEVHDRFRLAVLIHYLLFGYHPFSGEWTGAGESPEQTELIRSGYWYGGQDSLIRPSQTTIPLDVVHPEIKRCFLQCFNDGHTAPHLRPTAEDWRNALQVALNELTVCSQVDSHYYSRTYGRCYWCERKASLGVDIFPAVPGKPSTVVKTQTVPSKLPTNAQPVLNSISPTKTVTQSASPSLAASSTQKGSRKSWITRIKTAGRIKLFLLTSCIVFGSVLIHKKIPIWLNSNALPLHETQSPAQINIDLESPAFSNRELKSGSMSVLVDYSPAKEGAFPEDNLQYQIFFNGIKQIQKKAFTRYSANISIQDLDNNDTPEVIVETYSGGTHCCTNFLIYSWQNNQLSLTETGDLDGSGGEFRDLERDGLIEFLTVDNSFFYQFDAFVYSFPPSQILSFRNGELQDVTRQYPAELEAHARQMRQALFERKRSGETNVNGLLAGYVAQKILLGEFQEGWDFMLAHYNQTSDWGLSVYEDDRIVGQYPDFPTALKTFLIEQGYLKY